MDEKLRDLLGHLSSWLQFQQRLGVSQLPRSVQLRQTLDAAAPMKTAHLGLNRQSPISNGTGQVAGLAEVRSRLGDCRRCDLCLSRRNIVFGEGPETARLMIVGEAPGRDEDIQGRPFVGVSGELLTRMLQAIDLARTDVYITSVLKCRPPRNRTPESDEIARCSPFLFQQMQAIAPHFVLALGGVAAAALLGKSGAVTSLRGRFHTIDNIRVLVTYHPAYLLRLTGERQKALKLEAWRDLQMLQREYAGMH